MNKQFKNAFILSGGGTRSMIYLGMYAALEKLNIKPDVLIGTCGGSFAATVINTFSDNNSRKEYLKSEEYFQFITKKRLTEQRKLSKITLFTLRKILDKRNAPFIEDVFNYLAEMPQDITENAPLLKTTEFSKEIPTLIIGSEILFDTKRIGQKRNEEKLYQKVIFTDADTAKIIDLKKIEISSQNHKNSAVAESTKIITTKSMLASSRISISDMFYFPPVSSKGTYYAGGAIDLIPIELAKHIAHSTIIEKKKAYTNLEESLVRSVLGYSGNKRLEEVQNYAPEYQIDTRNIKDELEGHYINKIIDWKKMEICFEFPTYDKFKKDMDIQWAYGFQQTIKGIKI